MDFRIVPLCGLLAYEGLALGWRSWLQWRYHGGHGIQLFRSGSWRQHLRDGLFLALGGLLLLEAVGAARGQVAVAEGWALRVLGVGLVVAGTVCTVAAQLDLGASWRVGIEETARPGLVTTGWYAWSRNPIFLFMLLFVTGFAVLVPTPVSAGVAVASYLLIRTQVRDEERYLLGAYGEAYREYARRVGRFVPAFWGLTSRRPRDYSEIEKRFQFRSMTRLLLLLAPLLALARSAPAAPVTLAAVDEGFAPAEVEVVTGAAIQLAVTNQTQSAIEFESYELNRERVIQPGQTVTIYLSALDPGRYAFFDDFHQERRGTLVVK